MAHLLPPRPHAHRPVWSPGRLWRGKLHAHSHLSDGALIPEQVVDAAAGRRAWTNPIWIDELAAG